MERRLKIKLLLPIYSFIILSGCTLKHPDNNELRFPELSDIQLSDGLLGERYQLINETTIFHCIEKCKEEGLIENFSRAAGITEGDYLGLPNADEFVYKTVEAASYLLAQKYNKELDLKIDSIVRLIAAAQEPDGYLRTPHTIYWLRNGKTPRARRWSNLNGDLELYCSGHLIEAAVVHYKATGKKNLLNVALKNVNLIDSLFGKGKKLQGVDMIPEIELALLKLFKITDNKQHLDLAKYFIYARGDSADHKLMGPFSLDHKPLKQQKQAVGHATFAVYLYSAATDMVNLGIDTSFREVIKNLWNDIVFTKMSINGGIGSRHDNEGFGEAYDLPDLTAYNEICAAVGFCNLNQRMFQMEQNAKYFDVLEHTLYNNLLSGIATHGKAFFYVCPTESDTSYKFNLGWCPPEYNGNFGGARATRKEWLPCACCPPTLARFVASLPSMVYALKGNNLYVNLYTNSKSAFNLNGQEIEIIQNTHYPWDGDVQIEINSPEPFNGQIMLRIPSWVNNYPVWGNLYNYLPQKISPVNIKLNGKIQNIQPDKTGYVSLSPKGKRNKITIHFPMEIRKVVALDSIRHLKGKVVLKRGPLLYCFEQQDNDQDLGSLALNNTGDFKILDKTLTFGETRVISNGETTAIPYFLWSNRGENKMKVWIRKK